MRELRNQLSFFAPFCGEKNISGLFRMLQKAGEDDVAREPNELAYEDYRKGMKYKDIAEKYGVSINTVKSWKTRYKWSKDGAKGVHTKKEKVCTQKEDAKKVVRMLEESDLNDKQKLFCLYYSKSFNATRSYQKVYGCTYETALSNGPGLLGNTRVKAEIMRIKEERYSQSFLRAEDIFQKYMDIAFADLTDYVRINDLGETEIRGLNEIDGTIVSEISSNGNGVKVKLHDSMKALQWLTDHMNMATEEQKARIAALRAKSKEEGEGEKDIVVKFEGGFSGEWCE